MKNINLQEIIEKEQLENDRNKLINKKDINDVKWRFIEELIIGSKDKKINEHDISLINKYTEKIKKEFRL